MRDGQVDRRPFISAFGTPNQIRMGKTLEAAAYADQVWRLGVRGLRYFVGNLTWQGQTADDVRQAIPATLKFARDYGFASSVVPCTDTAAGQAYDERGHTRFTFEAIRDGGFLDDVDVGQEFWHPTQSATVHDRAMLVDYARTSGLADRVPWCVGAAELDELNVATGEYDGRGGSYNGTHPRRLYHYIVQIARFKELNDIAIKYGTAASIKEPVGFDEIGTTRVRDGSRLADPTAFFFMGVLAAIAEQRIVFHGQACLRSEVLGPNQVECLRAGIEGYNLVVERLPKDRRGAFTVGHRSDSPFKGTFYSDDESERLKGGQLANNRVYRIHSWYLDNWGLAVCSGVAGDPGYINNGQWRRGALIAQRDSIQVFEVTK